MQNGILRIHRINSNNFRDLSDYWELSMHCNANGIITAIKLSFDKKFLYTIGADGNIFSYNLNIDIIIDDEMNAIQPISIDMNFEEVSDIYDFNCLSLEQEKQKNNADAHQKIIDLRKNQVYNVIEQFATDYRDITERNKILVKSQQIALDQMDLDGRITEHLQCELQELRDIECRKMAFDVEKTKIRAKKVRTAFLSSIQNLPVRVDAIG